MDAGERARLITQYRDGYQAVQQALDGITDDALDHAADGGWTPWQIVHHLADAEMIGAERLRRLLAESEPRIQAYDEAVFAARLPTDRPIEPSLQAMRWARESTSQLLELMTDADWRIVGTHSEGRRYGTEDWLRMYAAHAFDHANQIKGARGRV